MKARENPYRVERVHAIPFLFADGDLSQLLHRLKEQQYRGAIVGPHGSGKTTLIENLKEEFRSLQIEFAHCRLQDDGKSANRQRLQTWISRAPCSAVLILDSAGLLGWRDWRWLRKQSLAYAGLLITTHRQGRLPTVMYCQPSLATLQSVVDQLQIAHPPTSDQLKRLFKKHRGNIRDCLRELYDEYTVDEISL